MTQNNVIWDTCFCIVCSVYTFICVVKVVRDLSACVHVSENHSVQNYPWGGGEEGL